MKMVLKDYTEFDVDSLNYSNRGGVEEGRYYMTSILVNNEDIRDVLKSVETSLTPDNISKVTFETEPTDGSFGTAFEYSFKSVDAVNMHIRDSGSSIDIRFVP